MEIKENIRIRNQKYAHKKAHHEHIYDAGMICPYAKINDSTNLHY